MYNILLFIKPNDIQNICENLPLTVKTVEFVKHYKLCK